jgi:hypothetical protein
MLDKPPIPPIAEAVGQPSRQSQATIELPQQQHPAVARQRATGKISHHFARAQVLKLERSLLTVCRSPGAFVRRRCFVHTNNFSTNRARSSPAL